MAVKVSSKHVQQGSLLKIEFLFSSNQYEQKRFSELFNINNLAEVWFKFEKTQLNNNNNRRIRDNGENTASKRTISIRISKHELAKEATVKLQVNCGALGYTEQFNCPEISTYWKEMGSFNNHTAPDQSDKAYLLEISIIVSKIATITFGNLYDDTEMSDFCLTTADKKDSVAVHKVCLAAHSEVFKAMLSNDSSGKWKETAESKITLKGATLQTLQHLKDYLYLGTLPDGDLLQLLLLAKCYMIENLKEECIVKLAQTVTVVNLYKLLEFACENNIPELAFKLVQMTPSDITNGTYESMVNK